MASRPSKIKLSTSPSCQDMLDAISQPAPPVIMQIGSSPMASRILMQHCFFYQFVAVGEDACLNL